MALGITIGASQLRDMLKPNIGATVQERQIQQQLNHDVHSKVGNFRLVTQCLLRNLVMVPSG